MRGGCLYEPRTSAPRTDVSGCLSSSTVMPTPQASDWERDNNPSQANRKSPSITAVDYHFATPTAAIATGGPPNADRGRRDLRRDLLPTPEAKLGSAGPDYARASRPGSGGDDLTTAVYRLTGAVTPTLFDDGKP